MNTIKSEIDNASFTQMVYSIVSIIPLGRATCYGAIAKAIGYPNMSRKVGKVLGNSSTQNIQAHRVVNSQGILSARNAFATPSTMQERLEAEGIVIRNNRIVNWKKIFWDPIAEIDIEE